MSLREDIKVIEADKVEFKAPFVPKDIELSNAHQNNALKFTSNVKVDDGFNLTLGVWKISHDSNKLYFYKNEELKMSLE
tara:strand:- start:39 stop:275 length:237 start_codon:yes stop_codon:yes gene_type:complete